MLGGKNNEIHWIEQMFTLKMRVEIKKLLETHRMNWTTFNRLSNRLNPLSVIANFVLNFPTKHRARHAMSVCLFVVVVFLFGCVNGVLSKKTRSMGTQKNAIHERFTLHLISSWARSATNINWFILPVYVRSYVLLSFLFFVLFEWQTYWMLCCVCLAANLIIPESSNNDGKRIASSKI